MGAEMDCSKNTFSRQRWSLFFRILFVNLPYFIVSLFFSVSLVLSVNSEIQAATNTFQSVTNIQSQSKVLIVGSEQEYPPFSTGMTDESAGGFTVELWKAVAVETGWNYTLRVQPFHQVLDNFKNGNIDLLINLAISDERDKFADFTVPHVIVHGAIFVRKGEISIRSEEDLAGKSIIVLNADLAHDYAIARGWEKQLVPVATNAEGMKLLASGKHDAMLLGKLTGMQTLQKTGLTNIIALPAKAGFAQKFAFAVPEGQSRLLATINEGLALTKSNGTYDKLYHKWFGIYKTEEVSWRDVWQYILPFVVVCIGIAGYFFYRWRIERETSARKYQDLYDNAPVMFLSVEPQKGAVIDCNQTLLEVTGYTREEIVGHPVSGLYHPDCTDIAKAAFQSFLSNKIVHNVELQLQCKGGRNIDIILNSSAVCNKQGAILYSRSSLHDISARKQAEKERRKLQLQLNQAHKMEAIGIMAGGIAHDFNNLLSIVSSNIGLLQHKLPTGDPSREHVELINGATSRAKALVSQILAFSRQEKTELGPVNLARIVEDTLLLLRSTFPATIEIISAINDRQVVINADTTQLQQVLINLCTNSVHAMADKGLLRINQNAVVLTAEDLPKTKGLPSGLYAQLSIRDTGTGIEEELLKKIFDPFFTTKAVGQGTGMGLAVTHGIVEQYGGFITVESDPGLGSTFNLYFPSIESSSQELEVEQTESLPTGTESILFVDDEECIAYSCKELLECQGYTVTSVTNSLEALELFKTRPNTFDLVFTDQTMPNMTGIQLATELLKIRADIPIILCSGYSVKVSEDEAKNIGFIEFCMKPMDMKQLATVARKVLDTPGASTQDHDNRVKS
jgi:PAS domain S-box-containing protein